MEEKKLKTLEENNSFVFSVSRDTFSPRLNGIACPKCGSELLDSQPCVTLASYPPQKNINCSSDECDYVGYRFC